jgi:hypothetical protein
MSETTIIEINGVKLEVDLRHAKKVENLRVGDTVKVLRKEYSDTYKSFAGVIVGFDAFQKLPSIIIACIGDKYDTANITTFCYNAESKDIEIVPANEHDISFDKSDILSKFDKEIEKKYTEIKELESKRNYFLYHFKKYFEHSPGNN